MTADQFDNLLATIERDEQRSAETFTNRHTETGSRALGELDGPSREDMRP